MNLDDLEKIQQVDPPPFLFTRILQKIEDAKQEKVPKYALVLVSLAFSLLLIVNSMALINFDLNLSSVAELAQTMQLTTSNDLY